MVVAPFRRGLVARQTDETLVVVIYSAHDEFIGDRLRRRIRADLYADPDQLA